MTQDSDAASVAALDAALREAEKSADEKAIVQLHLKALLHASRAREGFSPVRWRTVHYQRARRCLTALERLGADDLAFSLAEVAIEQAQANADKRRTLQFQLRSVTYLTALRRLHAAERRLREALGCSRFGAVEWISAALSIHMYGISATELEGLQVWALYAAGRWLASAGHYERADSVLSRALALVDPRERVLSRGVLALRLAEVRLDAGDLKGLAKLQREFGGDETHQLNWRLLDAMAQVQRENLSLAEVQLRELALQAAATSRNEIVPRAHRLRFAALARLNRLDEAEQVLVELGSRDAHSGRLRRLLAGRDALRLAFPPEPRNTHAGRTDSLQTSLASCHAVPVRVRAHERFRDEFTLRAQEILLALDAGEVASATGELLWLKQLSEPVESPLVQAELALLYAQLALELGELATARTQAASAERAFGRLHLPARQRDACMAYWLTYTDRAQPEAEALRARMDQLTRAVQQSLTTSDQRLYLLNKWAPEDWRVEALVARFERRGRTRWTPARLQRWLDSRAAFELLGCIDRERNLETKLQLSAAASRTQPQHGVALDALSPAWLAQDTAVLYYVSLPTRLLMFTMHSGRCQLRSLPIARTALWQLVEQLWRTLPSAAHLDVVDSSELARALGLDAVLAELPGELRNLHIVPDDILVHVPFGAICLDGAPLCNRFSVAIVPYPRWVNDTRQPIAQSASMLTVADPDLPQAPKEIALVSETSARTTELVGDAATRAIVLEQLVRHDVAHFACHGDFDLETPSASGLRLTQGRVLLTVRDIAGKPLSNLRLAFLHACWSANTRVLPGREFVGLASELARCGCQSIVTALWFVFDDAAVSFAHALYKRVRTQSVSRALALTQAEYSARSLSSWAQYVVYERGLPLSDAGQRRLELFHSLFHARS